jgi:hypothetical protein
LNAQFAFHATMACCALGPRGLLPIAYVIVKRHSLTMPWISAKHFGDNKIAKRVSDRSTFNKKLAVFKPGPSHARVAGLKSR